MSGDVYRGVALLFCIFGSFKPVTGRLTWSKHVSNIARVLIGQGRALTGTNNSRDECMNAVCFATRHEQSEQLLRHSVLVGCHAGVGNNAALCLNLHIGFSHICCHQRMCAAAWLITQML